MPRGALTKVVLACVFLFAFSPRGIARELKDGEALVSLGKPTIHSFAVNRDLVNAETGDTAGTYSIWVLGADHETNQADVRLDVNNFTGCPMPFEGTFLIDGEPIKFVNWGGGIQVPPHGSWTGRSSVVLKDDMQKFTFQPHATLTECPGTERDYEKTKEAVEEDLKRTEEQSAARKREEADEAEAKKKRKEQERKRAASRPPAVKKQAPHRAEKSPAPRPEMSCEQCGRMALRLARLSENAICHPELIALARTFISRCAVRSDCADALLRRWRDPALDTILFMKRHCRNY